MSVTIFLTRDNRWSAAAGGLITEFLVKTFKGDIYLSPVIQAIYDENINTIDLEEFTPERRREILRALSTQLVPYMEKHFSNDISERDALLKVFRDLADRATLCLESDKKR